MKLLVSAMALAIWAVIAHQLDPQENWLPDGPDYVVFTAVVLGCAAWQYGSDKKTTHSRISCNAHHLTITQEVERDRRTRVAEFSVPWASIDRIGIEGLGREAPLVVRFRADNGPTAEWLRRYGADRHPSGVGYVLCRPARVASGASSANGLISRLRTELGTYAGGRHGR
ncbi:hypothetical protein [Streptomyces sp. NPDC005549]|uniref:hypothetical protein n=1 Tax=Streptomyces sp. NPDC005549 TaxID=3154888 RepID=UPI0033A533E2